MARLIIRTDEKSEWMVDEEIEIDFPDKVFRAISRLRKALNKPEEILIYRRPRQGKIGPYTFVSVDGIKWTLAQFEAKGVTLYTQRIIQNFLDSKD